MMYPLAGALGAFHRKELDCVLSILHLLVGPVALACEYRQHDVHACEYRQDACSTL